MKIDADKKKIKALEYRIKKLEKIAEDLKKSLKFLSDEHWKYRRDVEY